MKSHHTTLHQFTLLSRRGVRLHLKNQAQQESLKKTLFENTHHLTQPINFGNYSLPPSFTLEKSKKKTHTHHNYMQQHLQLLLSTMKNYQQWHLACDGLQPCNWALLRPFFCFFYSIQCIPTSLYSGKHVYKLTVQKPKMTCICVRDRSVWYFTKFLWNQE